MPQALEHVLGPRGESITVLCTSAAGEGGEPAPGRLGVGVRDGADGEGDEHLVRVQARVAVAHVLHLQVLDGLDDLREMSVTSPGIWPKVF